MLRDTAICNVNLNLGADALAKKQLLVSLFAALAIQPVAAIAETYDYSPNRTIKLVRAEQAGLLIQLDGTQIPTSSGVTKQCQNIYVIAPTVENFGLISSVVISAFANQHSVRIVYDKDDPNCYGKALGTAEAS